MHTAEYSYHPPFSYPYELDSHRVEKKPSLTDPLEYHVNYLSDNAEFEGLPHNWYEFPGIGFSMQTQMDLYRNSNSERSKWISQTKRDILGFALEYLSDKLVYPYKYYLEKSADGNNRLVDPLYGNKDILDTVKLEERDGAVKDAVGEIKSFFLDQETPNGSLAVMTSLMGKTGLTTDNGKPISYQDSYFFIFQKNHDSIKGFTIKTDFSVQEGIKVINRLPGKKLQESANEAEIVRSVRFIPYGLDPELQTSRDLIRILEKTRKDVLGKTTPYKDQNWSEVYEDAENADKLYEFNSDVQLIIQQFEEFAKETYDPFKLQKGLAATILRISEQFLRKKNESHVIELIPNGHRPITIYDINRHEDRQAYAFGEIYKKTSAKGGCAGGGSDNESFGPKGIVIESLVPRLGFPGEKSEAKWKYHKGDCKDDPEGCGSKNIDIGPCGLCKKCENRPEYNRVS